MKLEKKKKFAAKVLGVGAGRIVFNKNRLADIKEAMTRQDILDLARDNAILVREIKGKLTVVRRKTRRRKGSIRMIVNPRKRKYITLTRKFRAYVRVLLNAEDITKEQYLKLRQEIRASAFKDKAHLKERIKLFKEQK